MCRLWRADGTPSHGRKIIKLHFESPSQSLDKLLISCFNKYEWLANTNTRAKPEQSGHIVRKPEKGNEEKMMEVTSVLQLLVLLSFLK